MVAMERGKYYLSGELKGLNKPIRDFPCKTPLEVSWLVYIIMIELI